MDNRAYLLNRIYEDLIGPISSEEILEERPIDRYLSGILYPLNTNVEQDEDEELNNSNSEDEEESNGDTTNESVILSNVIKPSCIGLSFRTITTSKTNLLITVSFGEYTPVEPTEEGIKRKWHRSQKNISLNIEVDFGEEGREIPIDKTNAEGIFVFVKPWSSDKERNFTIALMNRREKGLDAVESSQKALYQVEMHVRPGNNTEIIPRKIETYSHDSEDSSLDLLYSKVSEFSVGHTCSSEWKESKNRTAEYVKTSWFPSTQVSIVSPDGAIELREISSNASNPYSSLFLGNKSKNEVINALRMLPDAYKKWLIKQKEIPLQSSLQKSQAQKHLDNCKAVNDRIINTINFLASPQGEKAFIAFQAANRAMNLQSTWGKKKELTWRPFQLGFQLLVLHSLASEKHPDREVLDLLWFPTGGGKTEAYLGLVAFTVIYSRLSKETNPNVGGGVNVIMRYTLRLLTTQQFQRAARLVTACEYLRLNDPSLKNHLGTKRFSLGLWVGKGATPNKLSEVYKEEREREKAKQIVACPCCGSEELKWGNDETRKSKFSLLCLGGDQCFFSKNNLEIPIWTVDEDIYRELPSFLIGTIDKFAQICREPMTRRLFGVGTEFSNPSLIIQDELHLITGPLGTMTGLYEAAIDELCTSKGPKPKIIASTATIKNAAMQIQALFNRKATQFPPNGIYEDDSGYANKDYTMPGRLYLGVSTAGRSAKYVLQAVCASALQFSNEKAMFSTKKDDYWTIVTYFNSLRELGGAGVMMTDDVPNSIKTYAVRHEEKAREIPEISELTGTRKQEEITRTLKDLDIKRDQLGAIDVVLASSMISVGVDVDRLSIMIVNGQPKTISEYIQATSRVGRASIPGIVLTIYNHNKSRDKSRFETFCTWHNSLYKDVEGTSVTPFASRARDKALHSPLVVLSRYLIEGLLDNPRLDDKKYDQCIEMMEKIYERSKMIDPDEADSVREEMLEFLSSWKRKSSILKYWDENPNNSPLLISAETAASLTQTGKSTGGARATPNSMREVEPGVMFRYTHYLKRNS